MVFSDSDATLLCLCWIAVTISRLIEAMARPCIDVAGVEFPSRYVFRAHGTSGRFSIMDNSAKHVHEVDYEQGVEISTIDVYKHEITFVHYPSAGAVSRMRFHCGLDNMIMEQYVCWKTRRSPYFAAASK